VPPPDDTDDAFVSPFTGAPGTGFDGAPLIPAPVQATPKFNQRVFAYIGSLPRGEQKKAKDALRNYVYGPGKMQPDDAIKRYKERRVRDAQAPVGATDFDELDASDSDAEESDDDILGAGTGATYDPADMQEQQDNQPFVFQVQTCERVSRSLLTHRRPQLRVRFHMPLAICRLVLVLSPGVCLFASNSAS
jgi:hypothetical protein